MNQQEETDPGKLFLSFGLSFAIVVLLSLCVLVLFSGLLSRVF